jgi:hypothetical protein
MTLVLKPRGDDPDTIIAREFLRTYEGRLDPQNVNDELRRWISDRYTHHLGAVKASRATGYTPKGTNHAAELERFRQAEARFASVAARLRDIFAAKHQASIPAAMEPTTPPGPPLGRTPGWDVQAIQNIPMNEWGQRRGEYVKDNHQTGIFGPF